MFELVTYMNFERLKQVNRREIRKLLGRASVTFVLKEMWNMYSNVLKIHHLKQEMSLKKTNGVGLKKGKKITRG